MNHRLNEGPPQRLATEAPDALGSDDWTVPQLARKGAVGRTFASIYSRKDPLEPARPEASDGQTPGQLAARISTELVQLHHHYHGKGPTKAKTYFLDDAVICITRDGFTTVEETLFEHGRGESVHQMRRTFQGAMEDEFKRVVEEATGRTVVAYMTQIHSDPDMAVEIFIVDGQPG